MYATVGRLIACLGEPEFPRALGDVLRQTATFDDCVVFGDSGDKRPLALYNDFLPDRHRVHVSDFLEGPYILDPFFLASQDPERRGLYRLSDIAPDRFYQGEYFKSYYRQTGLAEGIGYLVSISESLTLVLSMMRRQRRFSAVEFRHLAALWPVVDAAARQHWGRLKHPLADGQDDIEGRIRDAYRSIGEGVLTPREREVVEFTLKGYSADAAGKALGISPGTIRIHRRTSMRSCASAHRANSFPPSLPRSWGKESSMRLSHPGILDDAGASCRVTSDRMSRLSHIVAAHAVEEAAAVGRDPEAKPAPFRQGERPLR